MASYTKISILRGTRSEAGMTLLETLIAAAILLFVLLSMVSGYALGRLNIDREEVKRKATVIAQDRLERVKSRYSHHPNDDGWEDITETEIDTTYVVDGTLFTVISDVTAFQGRRKNVSVDVNWTMKTSNNAPVIRKVRAATSVTRIVIADG